MALADDILSGARIQKAPTASGRTINIAFNAELKAKIQQEAADRGMTTSGLIKLALSEYLKLSPAAGDPDLPE